MTNTEIPEPPVTQYVGAIRSFKSAFISALNEGHISNVKMDGFVARLFSTGLFHGKIEPGIFSRALHVTISTSSFEDIYSAKEFARELADSYNGINDFYGRNQRPYQAIVTKNGPDFLLCLKDDDCYMDGSSLSDFYRLAGTCIASANADKRAEQSHQRINGSSGFSNGRSGNEN